MKWGLEPEATTSALVARVQDLLTAARPLTESISEIAAQLRLLLGAERVEVSLLNAYGTSVSSLAAKRRPAFVFSHPVQNSGGAVLGRLDVDLHQPALSPSLTLTTLHKIVELLALRAERSGARSR